MREIKFRVWDKNKMWYNVDVCADGFVYAYDKSPISEEAFLGSFQTGRVADTINLMQFTRLKDKNRKEIYEGDVIKASPKAESNSKGDKYKIGNRIYLVSYESGSFWIDSEKKDLDVFSFIDINLTDFEVIGNIYENPELIR